MKTVLITGVSGGLGKAMALEFQKNGFKVIGISRTKPECEIDFFIAADITQAKEREKIFKEVTQHFSTIDVFINNAGIGVYDAWETVKEEELREVFELNFFSVVFLTQLFLPLLKKSQATIINISSIAGKTYFPFMGPYCATKHALSLFSQTLNAELKPYGVRVIDVAPGRIKTGFGQRVKGEKRNTPKTPFLAKPEDFAKKVFQAYRRKKRTLIFPNWYRLILFFSRYFPSLYDSISLKKWNQR